MQVQERGVIRRHQPLRIVRGAGLDGVARQIDEHLRLVPAHGVNPLRREDHFFPRQPVARIDDEVRHMINKRSSTLLLRQRARELGMRTLREDGMRKVLAGLTSADEVISTTIGDIS